MRTSSPKPNNEEQRKKMILSSRASPPKPLKFGNKGSDRYLSIKNLLPRTPIPSPSLPSILPRHGKKPPKLNSRKIVRFIFWLSVLIGAYYLVSFGKTKTHRLPELTFLTSLGKTYEIVEASELPDYPTPLALTDSKGKHHWTISIPQDLGFPLPPSDYADICSQADEVARHVAGKHYKPEQDTYYYEDPNFVDVDEARAQHFLPAEAHKPNQNQDNTLPICEKSLTYVLDATDPGLGTALLGLWLSYSLAQLEGRTFFIDDTHFPFGNYSTFFTSRPETSSYTCRPPPPSHRVPCPHQAKHLAVSAATTPWIFGEQFHAHFSQRQIFDMARSGHDALFHLRAEDVTYVKNRAAKLRKFDAPASEAEPEDEPEDDNGPGDYQYDYGDAFFPPYIQEHGLVGMHIRRGDRHPFSLTYSQNYIPPSHYMAMALQLVGKSADWKFLVASDDADMYADHVDLPGTMRAQERISLASKKALVKMGHSGNEGLGWEGGFFRDVFWGLGLSEDEKWSARKAGSPMPMKTKERFGEKDEHGRERRVHHHLHGGARRTSEVETRDYRSNPTKEALQLRELLGRAYLLDLAMLAQSDKVVCGVSANACRILAVMLGWERAFEKNDWVNIDGGYQWRVMDY